MTEEHRQVQPEASPPISADEDPVTQTMLETGMMEPPPQPGILGRIGRFEVLRTLGCGGMGDVLLAREPVTDALVAIKTIKPRLARQPWAVRRFLTEAQHMYRMSHPNILRVLEVSNRDSGPYYVMQYVKEGSLADRLATGRPLDRHDMLRIGRQVASALVHAHGKGIIHRDLKPANVLIDADGRAYLTDFGLLRTVFNDEEVDVQRASVEGTAPYMSPRAAQGEAEDTRCDIYAFGAVLYEMLAGRPPYEGSNADAILRQVVDGPPRPVREWKPDAPAGLVQVAEKAMARELRDRYAEMADVVADLQHLEGDAAAAPSPPVAAVAPPAPSPTKSGAYITDAHAYITAALHLGSGCVGLAIALVVLISVLGGGFISMDETAIRITSVVGPVVAILISLFCLPAVVAGFGFFYGKMWARIILIILCALDLTAIPFGTILGVYGLWALLRRAPAATAPPVAGAR